MALQLEIISEHKEIVGDDAVREFIDEGGTIGRSLQNDWILPDPDKYISGKHAAIDCRGGMYYLADLSTNGTFINDEYEPIGKGNPRRLFNGDRLRLGDFEIVVTIDQGESIAMPLEDTQTEHPEPLEQPFDEVSLKSGIALLDEEEITGDDEFENALFGSEVFAQENAPPALEIVDNKPRKSKPGSVKVEVTSDDLFDTFLDGLGVSRTDFHPSVDPAEVMQNAGEVMREFVDGMGRLLVSRANLKTAFSLDQTTVLPRHNNPLKLSENTMDSVMQLLVGREGEYLGPRDAVREVCRDLLFHQDAFLDAMSNAFVDFADRFEPEELKAAFERSIDKKPLFSFMNTLKYWQLYCDLYPVMTERGGARFPHMFAEEFVQSYERQINEFKRLDTTGIPNTAPPLEPLDENEFEAEIQDALNDDDIDDDIDNEASS
jgi:predicted component of type VI protein secretion system